MRPALCWSFLIVALFIHGTKGSNDKPLDAKTKNNIVKSIIAKVTNMTMNAFAKVDTQQKLQILEKIRGKLVNASKSMGPDGRKYVDIVMEGVEATAFDDPDFTRIRNNISKTALHTQNVEEYDTTKTRLVQSIAKKIEALTKGAFYNVKTNEEKQTILKNIMNRVVKAANKHKIMVRSKNAGTKPYGELVVEGVELVLRQQFVNGTERRTNIDLISNSTNSKEENNLQMKSNEIDRSIMNLIKPEDLVEGNAESTVNTVNPLSFTSTLDLCGCSCIVNKTCTKISALSKFTCRRDNVVIHLEKTCDAVSDCRDNSDEEQCSKNAVKALHSANHILKDIEKLIPRGCLKTNLDENTLTSQHVVLKNVLQAQVVFLDKFYPVKEHLHVSTDAEKRAVINQINVVVSTVGFALESAFCVHEGDEVVSRRGGTLVDESLDDMLAYRSWAPPLCVCDEDTCAYSNCSTTCGRHCWQRHSLGQWSCPAVNFDASVPLDFICDGKVDCYDETDERDCSTGNSMDKFDASDMYNFIIKLLESKIKLEEYHPVLNKLNALQESIKMLQKYSIKIKPDVSTVKGLRDKCFSVLISIYDHLLERAEVFEKVDEAYVFLGTVSEKLLGAMKRSNTGNERILVNDNCLCRGGGCVLPQCSQTCARACAVNSKVMMYSCRGDTNKTIMIDGICDRLEDCPAGDDEADCQPEICRNHHLVVLRDKLEKMKDFHKGIAVGETLRSWKTKAVADLLVAEKRSRITRRGVRKAVAQILQDLTMSYASLGGFRRSRDKIEHSVDRFLNLARLVQDTLRTCTK